MLFNSLRFLIFFPSVVAVYFSLPHRYRWVLLLVASSYFYMVFIPRYILVLFFLIAVDYCMGIAIENSVEYKKPFLIASIISNIGVLFVFKYFNFFNANIEALAHLIHWNYSISYLTLILPIGLSFHTFQSLSYIIEVYRGRQRAEHHLGIYAVYVMFFPQLVAGPIERPYNLIHQFYERHVFDYQRVTNGLVLMLWGFFKKVVIADTAAVFVTDVFSNPVNFHGIIFLVASGFFAVQIYCDFSGYSDIALGAARVLGFTLMKNFDRPYFSKTISEFWQRWHISLTGWFRDYVYIPLGGNKVARWRWYANIFLVFLISGLWHGANWTFVFWGLLNGFYLNFSIWTKKIREKFVFLTRIEKFPMFHKFFQIAITFILTCIGWIFFRANNVNQAFYILTHAFEWDISSFSLGTSSFSSMIMLLMATLVLFTTEILQGTGEVFTLIENTPRYIMWPIYYTFILWVLWVLFYGSSSAKPFIYFQF